MNRFDWIICINFTAGDIIQLFLRNEQNHIWGCWFRVNWIKSGTSASNINMISLGNAVHFFFFRVEDKNSSHWRLSIKNKSRDILFIYLKNMRLMHIVTYVWKVRGSIIHNEVSGFVGKYTKKGSKSSRQVTYSMPKINSLSEYSLLLDINWFLHHLWSFPTS